MRLRFDIAYDGTRFHGWGMQPNLRTVQAGLEYLLGLFAGSAVKLAVAGRTDAGVHASGQVAHADITEAQRVRLGISPDGAGEESLVRRMNRYLGGSRDVHIIRVSLAPEGFDARFSAVWRRYAYCLADDVVPYDVFQRNRVARVRGVLDVALMNDAASRLIGLHDFTSYCRHRERATRIRTLYEYSWMRNEEGVLQAHLRADAFCHSMVRSIAGVCAEVGLGKLRPEDAEIIREAKARTSAFRVLAPTGLTLCEVGYPADALLAQRAEQTRARRSEQG